jgi:hypothetical protein
MTLSLVAAGGTVLQGYQAQQTNKANAAIQEIAAADAIDRGHAEEAVVRRQVAAFMGTQRTQIAASGVEMDSGSPSDLLADTAMLGELDALTVRNNAQREAFFPSANAEIFRNEADNAVPTAILNAGGQVASKWKSFKS